jgi:hypothetical protein
MTKKPLTLVPVLALVCAIVGDGQPHSSLLAKSYQSSNASASQQQTASADSNKRWEYRILTSTIDVATPYLEGSINKLAEQGYVVESFQAVSSPKGTMSPSFELYSRTEIVVLLKRVKK